MSNIIMLHVTFIKLITINDCILFKPVQTIQNRIPEFII